MDDHINQTTLSPVVTRIDVGRRIAEKRAAAHLTQRAFAPSVGLKPSRLAKLEMGIVEPRLLEVAVIARALGLNLDELAYTSPRETAGEREGRRA